MFKDMSNKTLALGTVILVVGLLIVGRMVSGTTDYVNTPSVHGASAAAATRESSVQDITLPKLGGGTIALSEYVGKKPVVLDFFASWCPNCKRDMPKLSRMYEKYKDQVEVIGINLQERESTVQKFITSRDISFPIAMDPRSEASRAFGIQYTNTHFLIDIDGNLVRTIPGDISESDILALIK